MSDSATAANPSSSSSIPAFIAAGLALLIWGGTSIANKIAVGYMDDLSAGVLRSLLAGAFAVVIVIFMRLPFPKSGQDRAVLLVSGISCFAIWPMMLSFGIGRTTAGHAALIMATIPIFTVLFAAVVEHRRPSAMWWFGAALAFAGTAALIINRGLSFNVFNDGSSIFGDLIILGGGAVCALGYVAGGKLSPKIGTVATTFWGLAVALVLLIPVFTVIIGRTVWVAVPGAGWLSILWMSLLSSLAGYVLWFYALGRGGIGRIGSLQMAQPVVTLVAAAVILSETLTIPLLATGAMIVAGTFTAQCHVR